MPSVTVISRGSRLHRSSLLNGYCVHPDPHLRADEPDAASARLPRNASQLAVGRAPQACAHRAACRALLSVRLLRDAAFPRAPCCRVRLPVHFPAVAENATAGRSDVLALVLFPAVLVLRLPDETVVAPPAVRLVASRDEIVRAPTALQDERGNAACSKAVRLQDAALPVQFPQGAVLLELRPFESALRAFADGAVLPAAVRLERALRVERLRVLLAAKQALLPVAQRRTLVLAHGHPVVPAYRPRFLLEDESQALPDELQPAGQVPWMSRPEQLRVEQRPAAPRELQQVLEEQQVPQVSSRPSLSQPSQPQLALPRSPAPESAYAQVQRASCRWSSSASFFR